jgi:hypothetical protein
LGLLVYNALKCTEKVLNHAWYDPDCCFDPHTPGRFTGVATQPKLGVRSKWRVGAYRLDRPDPLVAGKDMKSLVRSGIDSASFVAKADNDLSYRSQRTQPQSIYLQRKGRSHEQASGERLSLCPLWTYCTNGIGVKSTAMLRTGYGSSVQAGLKLGESKHQEEHREGA